MVSNEAERLLLHLCGRAEWAASLRAGSHEPPSLTEVGFIHLSAPHQVHLPANALFAGRDGVLLLVIDADRLTSPVAWEPGDPPDPGGMRYPHLYGPLPVDAVVNVIEYRPDADGSFGTPDL